MYFLVSKFVQNHHLFSQDSCKGVDTMAETFVVVSKIKKMVKDAGYRTGGDYIDSLSNKVIEIVKASIEKVKSAGGKKTLGTEDL